MEAAPDVLQALLDGKISEGHARALQGLVPQTQNAAVASVLEYHFSVRQTEELARNLRDIPEREQLNAIRNVIQRMLFLASEPKTNAEAPEPKKPAEKPTAKKSPELIALEEELTAAMEFKTTIKQSGKGGTITIEYYNEEDLNTLTDKLLKD